MGESFVIRVDGLDKLLKVFKELPKQVQKGVSNELLAIGQEWVNKAKADVPVDRARLKGSISTQVDGDGLTIRVVAQNEQAPYMEFGTKTYFTAPSIIGNYPSQFKGSSPSGVNPIIALTEWVGRKGIAGTYSVKTHKRTGGKATIAQQNRSMAFAIWNKIKKYGVHAHPYMFTGKDGSNRMQYFIDETKRRVAGVLKQII